MLACPSIKTGSVINNPDIIIQLCPRASLKDSPVAALLKERAAFVCFYHKLNVIVFLFSLLYFFSISSLFLSGLLL